MSDFLHFLNSASADALTELPGISPALAENIISARPFNTIDDCLKVRGVGKNLIARVQASYEESKTDTPIEEKAMTPIEQNTSIEKRQNMEEKSQTEAKQSFGSKLGQAVLWFFRALVRLILIILIIGGIGTAIYYGLPFINNRFIAPMEQNVVRVNEIESEIASLQEQIIDINSQLNNANDQIVDNYTQLETQINGINSRFDQIEKSLEALTASLEKLEGMQAILETQLAENSDKSLLAMQHEVMLTRTLDTLARARLYLAQSNFGLAKEDVQSARDLLAGLQADTADEVLAQVIDRLDLTLTNLPDFPVVASGDLEIAWQILVTGETSTPAAPDAEFSSTVTPKPTAEPAPSATPTP